MTCKENSYNGYKQALKAWLGVKTQGFDSFILRVITRYYEVEFAMPGDRMNPPQVNVEWWRSYNHSAGKEFGKFDLADAQLERQRIKDTFGFKTRLREVKTTTILIEEDD